MRNGTNLQNWDARGAGMCPQGVCANSIKSDFDSIFFVYYY